MEEHNSSTFKFRMVILFLVLCAFAVVWGGWRHYLARRKPSENSATTKPVAEEKYSVIKAEYSKGRLMLYFDSNNLPAEVGNLGNFLQQGEQIIMIDTSLSHPLLGSKIKVPCRATMGVAYREKRELLFYNEQVWREFVRILQNHAEFEGCKIAHPEWRIYVF